MILFVRAASIDDAAQVTECLSELGYDTPGAVVAENLAKSADSSTDAVLVAIGHSTRQVLGVASVHLIPLFHVRGHLARITALAVRRTAQRQGVGRALAAAAEAHAREAGCLRIEVTSGDRRPEAHEFYLALGFHTDERRFLKHLPSD